MKGQACVALAARVALAGVFWRVSTLPCETSASRAARGSSRGAYDATALTPPMEADESDDEVALSQVRARAPSSGTWRARGARAAQHAWQHVVALQFPLVAPSDAPPFAIAQLG